MLPPEYAHQPAWIFPRLPFGDADGSVLYMAVGRALSQWEELETELSLLFATLVESTSNAALRAYGIVASAQGRYDLLDNAAEVYFAERDEYSYAQYRLLLKILRLASPRRNDIAHGVVREYAAPDVPGGGSYLVSPDYNSRRSTAFVDSFPDSLDPFDFARHKYAYTVAQISSFRDRVSFLARETRNMVRALRRAASRSANESPES